MTGQAPPTYLGRKLAEKCTRSGCDRPPADDHLLCDLHRADHRARNAEYAARTWQARRRRNECGACGAKLSPDAGSLCLACKARRGRLRGSALDNGLDKAGRIAGRTVTHADGRTRYHGQRRRGQQPRIQLDQQDLGDAIKQLQRAQAAMAYAQSSEVQELPRAQRDEVVRAALGQVGLAGRFLDDISDRNRKLNGPVRLPAPARKR